MKNKKIIDKVCYRIKEPFFVALSLVVFTIAFSGCRENLVDPSSQECLSESIATKPATQANFRVVGYYYDNSNSTAIQPVNFKNLTHIIFSSSIEKESQLVVKYAPMAHANGVKAMISVGGDSASIAPANRGKYINAIMNYCTIYNMDGVDVDIEGRLTYTHNYESFVISLGDSVKKHNMIYTAAIDDFYKYTDKALAQFDFFNVMSYGYGGSPSLGHPDPGLARMQTHVRAYITSGRIPKEKINLGLLLARGGKAVGSFVTQTIDETNYALNNAAGIMVWDLNLDPSAPYSFLDLINKTILNAPIVFTPKPVNQTVEIGDSVTFTSTINIPWGTKYNWQLSKDNGTTWEVCGSHTNPNGIYYSSGNLLRLTPKSQYWQAYRWRLAATYVVASFSSTVYSDTVSVTITK